MTLSRTDLTGTYLPAGTYTTYSFNESTHNWYNNTDYGTTTPPRNNVSDLSPTYTWSLTENGGGNASIDSSTGELTISGVPTGNITVRLTVGNISPLDNKTVDLTLTRASVAESTTTTTEIVNLTLTPNPCTLDYQGSQAYTVNPTVNKTTSTTPAHITLKYDINTYYYCNGVLSTDVPAASTTTTHPSITGYSWSITGSNAATISSTTGASTTVTYSSVLSQDAGAILSLTATTEGATATATATINLNKTLPTSITPESSSFSICVGDENIPLDYTLSPAGCYDYVTVTTSDATIVELSTAVAFTDGHILIDAGHTAGTATLTLTAATGVTATVTVVVQPMLELPTITFDNTTSEVTIESDVNGAIIYYRTDDGAPDPDHVGGLNPTQQYTGPFTIISQANIKAFATKDGYCSATNTFATKIIYKADQPTLSVGSDGKVTMTSTTAGAVIYYTTDGSTPTATTGALYNFPVAIPSGSTVTAIAVKDDYINSDPYTLNVQAPAATPEITITDAGLVTITCGTQGATIYYTTDGSTPTTSSSTYSGAFTVTNGTTVRAIATKTGYLNSEVASNRYMTASGVSGTTVTINDAEDHLWSYYSDPECPIRSLSPADVKITYLGDGIVMTGNNDYTASSTDFVQPGNTNYVGGAKVNVGGENENTFVYYKTLERGDATQTAWTFSSGSQSSAASRCPYKPIPNPFQVRPTYGSRGTTDANNFTGWRGFQCWRLKSVTGGAVYSAASGGTALSTGAVINAETEIYFAPNGEYGMEVELEAVWARAYLVKGNNANENSILNYGNLGVERNFMTLTASQNYRFNGTSGRRITNVNRAVTISCYYPNGEAPDNTGGVVTGNNNNITLGANTKFENVTLSAGSYTLTASGYDLIVGRGCTSTNVGTVRGMSDGSTSAVNYTIRLESGTYGTFALIDNSAHTYSSTISSKAVFGCDYDRVKKDNNKLSIASNNTIYGGNAAHTFSGAANRNNITYDWMIKSGKVQGSKTISDAAADESIYIGNSISGSNANSIQYCGKRRLTMEGGEIASVAGSVNCYGTNYANYGVDDGSWSVMIRLKGGTVRGSIYGAAAYAGASGNRLFVMTGGTVNGWIAGGANGTQSDGGMMYGASNVYIGGNTSVNSSSSTSVINRATGGNVFGAGCGYGASSQSGQVTEGTTVVVADNAYVERGVYGGGSFGYTEATSHIYVLGGTVDGKAGGVNGTSYSASITGGVFGGACQNRGGTVNITMKDGQVNGGMYGGSNVTGTISGNVTMHIDGGQVGLENNTANIHGGGFGQPTVITGNVDLTLGQTNQTEDGVTVYGDVYGGSALGSVNGTSVDASKHTNVTLNKGAIHGSLYGGALGDASTAANVYGAVTVIVNGGSVTLPGNSFIHDLSPANMGGVFGCNNINGAPKSTVTVTVNGTDYEGVDNVFGGGNHAVYDPPTADYPTVTINGGMVNNCVFGGGNEADIKGNANITMTGGTVQNRVFGGCNLGSVGTYNATTSISGHTSHSGCTGWPETTSSWTKGGRCTITISGGKVGKDNLVMPQDYGYVFGGSRGDMKDPALEPDIEYSAYAKETYVTISGTAFIIGGVYGGGENGHIKGDTHVNIQANCQIGCGEGKTERYTDDKWSAAIDAVTGGDAAGIIAAAADMPECPHWNYQEPYLVYDPNNAYPGGSTIGYDGHTFYGNVFGGGSGYWPYEVGGNAQANGYDWLTNAGQVEGNTHVEITGGHILTSVYGGNELSNVLGDCYVTMSGGTLGVPRTVEQINAHPVTCYLFGAGKGDPRTHFNQSTNVGNTVVSVTGGTIFGSVFGGGEDGHVLGNATVTIGNDGGTGPLIGTWGTSYVDGNIFGGGRGFNGEALTAGVVSGNATINIKGGTMLGSIYGGGRLGSVGTYLVPVTDSNYGKLIPEGTQQALGGGTTHGLITINITGGTIGNTFEYIVPTGNWTQAWKESNYIPYTEFGSSGSDANRLMHTKGGNVFAGCMGRMYKLNGQTLITNWPEMGKARKTVLNISGGTIKSNVYGGGELGILEGDNTNTATATVTITGGTIGTEVYDTTGDTYPYYTYGNVFGGGYGSERNVTGSTKAVVNARDYAGLVTGNTVVDVSSSAAATRVWASVYGGGELAQVDGSTSVSISGENTKIGKEVVWHDGDLNKPSWAKNNYVRYGNYRMGNVFGGGKGNLDYVAAGLVKGNATVAISGGYVYHNVYGGGALGSVGTFTYDSGTGTTTAATGTGTTSVTITGGQIGINGYDNGMVNGSSRGLDGRPLGTNLDNVAWVNNSVVTIGTEGDGANFQNPKVFGAVYGGGENGHNYGSSTVNINSGIVGNTDPNATWQQGHVYGAGCGTDNYDYDADHDGVEETYYNPMAGIIHGAATLNIRGGHIVRAAYGGGSMGTTEGKAIVNVTGGRIGKVFGGPMGKEGAKAEGNVKFAYCGVEADVNINYASTPAADDGSTTQLVVGSVYGGGENGTVEGDVVVNMKKGLVLGDVYGGGALADTNIDNAEYYGQINETVTSTSAHKTTVSLTGGIVAGNVYGGALGRKYKAAVTAQPALGSPSDPEYVPAVAAQDEVTANPAYVYGDVLVELNKNTATDNCVVRGTIFGANNYNGTPKGEVTVHVYKTQGWTDDKGTADASDDVSHDVSAGKLDDTVAKGTGVYELKAVYGGGNEASYVPLDISTQTANVIIDGCSLTSIETVYGGGNAASAPGTHVVVNSCYEIGTVFGGGNGKDNMSDGSLNPGANVGYLADGLTSYGSGEAKVDALGGCIHQVFGGSNTRGNVRHESVAYIDGTNDACPLQLNEVYGGGNEAFMDGGSSLQLGCIDYLETIYGGANNANVGGDIVLTITSGRFNRVFGGNNSGGTINGSITVNIEETGCHPIVIGELYGCGNAAPYTTPGNKHPTVNLKSFTSIGRVYGGGMGSGAVVTGNPTVNINEVVGDNSNADVDSSVTPYAYDVPAYFDVDGNFKETTVPLAGGTTVVIPAHAKGTIGAIGTVFGGGNAAEVDGNTTVNIGTLPTIDYVSKATGEANPRTGLTVRGVDIRGNVFGGGNKAAVTGNTNVNIGRPETVTTP